MRLPARQVNLHQVTAVALVPKNAPLNEREVKKWSETRRLISESLARRGFAVTGDSEHSDALLEVDQHEWIGVDYVGPLPVEFIWHLVAPGLGVDWQKKVRIESKDPYDKGVREVLEREVEYLFGAWKDSAVRAGILTKAQAKALKQIR
jgi:hypothetical protein